MLVLSRKKNERLVINNDIIVTVIEIRGDKVRLGIDAPREMPVHRQEVYDAIRREGTQNLDSLIIRAKSQGWRVIIDDGHARWFLHDAFKGHAAEWKLHQIDGHKVFVPHWLEPRLLEQERNSNAVGNAVELHRPEGD